MVDRAHDDDLVYGKSFARDDEVDPLREPHARCRVSAQPADEIDPRAGGVHDHRCGDGPLAPIELVADMDPERRPGRGPAILDADDGGVGGDPRAVALRRLDGLQGQAGVVGDVLGVDGRSLELRGKDPGELAQRLVAPPDLVSLVLLDPCHLLPGPESRAELHEPGARPPVDRERQPYGLREMGRDPLERCGARPLLRATRATSPCSR